MNAPQGTDLHARRAGLVSEAEETVYDPARIARAEAPNATRIWTGVFCA
jgi:hypothetical protein